ncbi:MAG: nitroreductase family protein [Candidatus Hydrothermarchaeota archaeon]
MDVIEAIKERRSVREFTDDDVSDEIVREILDCARWAPSGINNQAWRFIVIKNNETKEKLSKLTHYGRIIRESKVCIAVFLDLNVMYDRTKDVQSIGACIQNMLLAVHALGLGAVWLGEILKNKEKVREILEAPEFYELMAVVALGYPKPKKRTSSRKDLSEITYSETYGNKFEVG